MYIADSLPEGLNLPIIASRIFLEQQSGVIKVGYFINNEMVLPFSLRKKYFLRWIQLYTEVLGCDDPEQERLFLNTCIATIKKLY